METIYAIDFIDNETGPFYSTNLKEKPTLDDILTFVMKYNGYDEVAVKKTFDFDLLKETSYFLDCVKYDINLVPSQYDIHVTIKEVPLEDKLEYKEEK